DDDFAPTAQNPPPKRSFLRRFRGFATAGLIILGGIAAVLLLGRWQVGRVGQQKLDVAVRQLDAAEPGWRLDAILEERKKNAPPPEADAAPEVLAVAAQLPQKEWNEWQVELFKDDNWTQFHPANVRPAKQGVAHAGQMAEPTRALRDRAIRLRDRKSGQYPLALGDDPIATALPHLDSARRVASLLQYDAAWETLGGNPNRGVAAARAALAVARSIGDEPLLTSQLVRLACASAAARAALQTLAWGESTEGLAELQAELLAEADTPWFQLGMRGERAMLDKVFRGLEDGTIPPEAFFRYQGINEPGPQHFAAFRAYQAFLPGDRAKCLEICTAYLEASKLPHEQQIAAIKAIEVPRPPSDFRFILTRLLTPACETVARAGLRTRAEMLTAATGVACERFRRKNGRFPHDLKELVPEFLPALPKSPFDGTDLRYQVFPDRIAVSFLWLD
ncbi:MAG: hypothetical protein K2V38_26640, partial [Gemmataceae bacterium]|nr:hypothetical protein [Gemmataceae bacterium]